MQRCRGIRTRAAGLIAVLALAALPTLATGPTAAAAEPIAWAPCTEDYLAGVECGTLSVPLDHTKPRGASIRLALSRIPATATGADYLGPLLLNFGGPGIEWRDAAPLLAQRLPPEVAGRFDLIGLDPRGVGASEPRLRCDASYHVQPGPDLGPPPPGPVRAAEKAILARTAAHVQACVRNGGAALKHMRSIDAVHDLEDIRRALGAPKLNLFGQSYGTYLGQLYASTYPRTTGRMVLSGVVGPAGVGTIGDLGRPVVAAAEQRNLEDFFTWVARFDAIYDLGADAAAVRAQYVRDEQALRAAPVGPMGPGEWRQFFLAPVYQESAWAISAHLWSEWAHGRPDLLIEIFAAASPEAIDASTAPYFAIACSDGRWTRNYGKLRAATAEAARVGEFAAWPFHWLAAVPCSTWPVRRDAVTVDGSAAPPLLFVNATRDAITLLTDALDARRAFGASVLIAEVGARSHAASAFDDTSTACVDALVVRYLLTGELPDRQAGDTPDVTCARRPEPGLPEIALVGVQVLIKPVIDLLPIL